MKLKTDIHSSRRGQSLVEMALLFPILLMLLMGLADFGRAYYITVALRDAADEGATYAAMRPNDYAGIQLRTSEASTNMVEIDPQKVTVAYPPTLAPGQPITVTVEYPLDVITPFVQEFFPDKVIPLRGQATHSIITVQ